MQMQLPDDMELLEEYALRGAEDAFAALVSRHVNLVYSVAMRQLGNQHDAQEVTQAVFIILAKKSKSLRREVALARWLFQTARLTAANYLRSEIRRIHREQGACMQSTLHETDDASWKQVAPFLNDAIASLGEKDRNAIVLRYLQGKSLKEVGVDLGWSEEAAKKRVSRAVEKLRHFFGQRGVTLSGAAVAGCITNHSVKAAPAGLAVLATAAAIKGTTVTASTTTMVKGTLKFMAWTKAKFAVGAAVAALVAIQSYEMARQNKQLAVLREQAQAQSAKPAAEPAEADNLELGQLRAENVTLSNEVFMLHKKLAIARSSVAAPPIAEAKPAANNPVEDVGRQLGLAVASGEPQSLEKLRALAKAEVESFNSKSVGMNDTERGDLARDTFAPLRAAFDVLTEEAVKGNPTALHAISIAIHYPELEGDAVEAVGVPAGNGDEAALQLLLHPTQYQILLSSAVGALKMAADNGNQKAIDSLAAVAADPTQQALWYMAADGLRNAAAAQNPAAVDALVGMSRYTNPSVRRAVISGLQQASANQNVAATEALRQMNAQ